MWGREAAGAMRIVGSSLALLLLCGCAEVGPRTVRTARLGYGEALSQSWNEQLLRNLVRLRYRDTPQFLEVSSIVTHYELNADGSLAVAVDTGGDLSGGLGAGVGYLESPTITYAPLQGEDFVTRMLKPLSVTTLLLLSDSGWSIGRLLACCVRQVGGLENAPSAAGPTPDTAPPFESFHRLASRLRELQVARLLTVDAAADGRDRPTVKFRPTTDPALGEALADVRRLLDVEPSAGEIQLTGDASGEPGEIAVVGRSLLAVTFFLSQGVEPPAEHETAGLVTVTRDSTGGRFDWRRVTGSLIRVLSQADEPQGAFVKVRYRGYWFYIGDSDLNSKSTFSLLTFLYSLQSTQQARSPLLTLSAGR